MPDFLSDTDVALTFRYGDQKQPSIPDTASVTYTVMDAEGTPIVGLVDVPVTTGPTTYQSTITIPAIDNAIGVDKIFSRRIVRYSYEVATVPKTQTVQYRLVPFVSHTVTSESVRAFIGINLNELKDEDIDLFDAYMRTLTDVPSATLTTALVSGTMTEYYANDAIRMQAVFGVIQSLRARIAQSEKNGLMGFDRPKITDFLEIMEAARLRYNQATGAILGTDTVEADFTLIVTTQDADPVTGA